MYRLLAMSIRRLSDVIPLTFTEVYLILIRQCSMVAVGKLILIFHLSVKCEPNFLDIYRILRRVSLNSDGHRFHQYQQSPLILTVLYWFKVFYLWSFSTIMYSLSYVTLLISSQHTLWFHDFNKYETYVLQTADYFCNTNHFYIALMCHEN